MTKDCARRAGALTALAVLAALALGACGSASDGPATATLAGSETAATSEATPEIAPTPAEGETPAGGQPWDDAATRSCDEALGAGYTQVAQAADDQGVTTFWTSGRRWAACDVAGETDPVVIMSTAGRPGFDERSLALSSTVLADSSERFVAGGQLPWPVDEIAYSFPDGHTEGARFVTSEDTADQTWWVVAYTATDGPLIDPETDPDDLKPVTISIVGAAAEAFRLPWEDLQRSE